jgi:flagellar biosynthesis/type III secretory pathway protein FliH
MRKTIQLSKWLLAAVLLMLTASGCGPRSQKMAALLSRKEKAIQVIDKIKSEKQLGLVEYEIEKIVKAKEEGREEGRKEGREEGRILEAVVIYRDEMHMSDESITKAIMNKFSLSLEDAEAYVM